MPYPTDREELTLAPAADGLDVAFTIHRAALPYVAEWFNDTKKEGEGQVAFIRRLLYTGALNHRSAKVRGNHNAQIQGQQQLDEVDYQAEYNDLLAAMEAIV